MNRIIDFIIKHYKYVLTAILLLTIPFVYFYANQKTFNHIDIFFEKDDPDIQLYKKFQKTYGNEEMGVIVLNDDNIFTNENIDIIRKISEMLKMTKGVQRVISITELDVPIGREDNLSFEKLIPDEKLTREVLNSAKERVLSYELMTQSLISKDCTTSAIMIELKPIGSNEEKGRVLTGIKNSASGIAGDKIDLHFSGTPYVEVEINSLTEKDNFRFTPITIILIFIIVAFLLKKFSLSILTQLNIYLIGIWGVGFLTLCGETMNMVTVVIPPILLAISVADSIHILAHYREIYLTNHKDHVSAVAESVKSLWLPCLFTSLTTGVGFISFITTSVRPVKTVGIFTSIGVMFAFIITIAFLPVALMFLRKRLEKDKFIEQDRQRMREIQHDSSRPIGKDKEEGLLARILSKIAVFTVDNYKTIGIIGAIVLVIAIIGMFRLRYETNFANYLPESNTIKKDITFIEKNLGGSVPIVMLIQAKSEKNDFTHPHSLKFIEDIQKDIMEFMDGRYTWSFSIADYFKELNKAFKNGKQDEYKIPDNRIDLLDYYELADLNDLERLVSPDRMEAKVSFLAHLSSSGEAKEMFGKIETLIKDKLGENYTHKHTGSGPLYTFMDNNLKESQVKSFFSALILIFIMMFFVCKGTKLAFISMIPNLFPILLIFGIMGWLNIPLDVTTIMIASVTIGIAVDDTIHFLVWFRRNVLSGMDISQSIIKTYRDTGKPIVITSVVLCMSYLVLSSGSVKPIVAFGILASLAMFFALIGDLLIFPAIILIFKPRVGK